jgi:ketosteroid isomerase-like protein
LVVEPGRLARGKDELRRALEHIVTSAGSVKQEKTHAIEANGIALFISRWTLSSGTTESRQFIATSVFRKQEDGTWRLVIDNAFGPAVLGA